MNNKQSLPETPTSLVTIKELATLTLAREGVLIFLWRKIRLIPATEQRLSIIRWQIINRDNNGLQQSGAVIKGDRMTLIDKDKYFSWQQSRDGEHA